MGHPEWQRQLHADGAAEVAFDEFAKRAGHLSAFAVDPDLQLTGYVLGGVARPALGRIAGEDAERPVIMAGHEIVEHGGKIGRVFIGLAPGRAAAEVLEDEIDVTVEPVGGNDRGRGHTQQTSLT
jgi:hypothetical protein